MKTSTYQTHILASLLLGTSLTACNWNSSVDTQPVKTEVIKTFDPAFEKRLTDYPEQMKARMLRAFDKHAQDGVVRAEQVHLLTTQYEAKIRGKMIGDILKLDLDGDNHLSPSEFGAINDRKSTMWMSALDRKLPYTDADTNKDGSLSLKEMQQFSREYAQDRSPSRSRQEALYFMAFDTDKNGSLTRAELENYMDDRIGETAKLNRRSSPTLKYSKADREVDLDSTCRPKALPKRSDKIVLMSGYEGTAYSSVAVTSFDDDTEVTRVKIEPGKTPLYIIASTYTSMLWSIEGDTDRVAGFIATTARKPGFAGAGVVGLDKKKVQFIPYQCVGYFKEPRSSKAIVAQRRFERILERDIDHLITGYKLDFVGIPSGKMQTKADRKANTREAAQKGKTHILANNGIKFGIKGQSKNASKTSLFRFTEDGLAIVPKRKVVSPGKVSTYDVYPQHAGILQLLDSGHLEAIDRRTFYIKKTFPRYPAGLGGGHAVKFILGKGVRSPKGSPGHSSVLSEETGKCLIGRC